MKKRKLQDLVLPDGVSYKLPLPSKYTQTTELTFIDSVYGEFTCKLYNLIRSGYSLHPLAKQQRKLVVVESISQNEEIKKKRKSTMLSRYGKEHALQVTEFYNKSIETTKKHWGVDRPLQNKECLAKSKATVQKNYGVDNPAQRPELCHILPNGKNITNFAEELGINKTTFLNQANLGLDFPTIQANMEVHTPYKNSTLEIITLKLIQKCGFVSSNKKLFKNHGYRPDFVNHDKKIAVDVDGLFVHSLKDSQYHSNKRIAYESEGWRLYQFRQDEIYSKPEVVSSIVANACGAPEITSVYARKCKIITLSNDQVKSFLSTNHLMGYCSALYAGLVYEDRLVYLVGYKRHKQGIDIIRSCPAINYRVLGGLSKLLSHIESITSAEFIQSWVDMRYGNGHSLIACGFEKQKEHVSWKWTDSKNTFNRLYCKAGNGFTEKENAEKLNLRKIYDAGQCLFIKKKGAEMNPAPEKKRGNLS